MLVIQRKGRYVGEYAPEVLACVDEYTDADNPDWWAQEVPKQLNAVGDDVDAHAIISIDLDSAALDRALYPEATTIPFQYIEGKHASDPQDTTKEKQHD